MIKAEAKIGHSPERSEAHVFVQLTMDGQPHELIEEASSIIADVAAGVMFESREMSEEEHKVISEWMLKRILDRAGVKLEDSRAYARRMRETVGEAHV